MRPLLLELCDMLDEQKSVLEVMLELSRVEKEIIISGEAPRLEAVVRQQFRELSKLNVIEKKRVAMHKAISEEFGLQSETVTLSAIAERAQPDEHDKIKQLQSELSKLLERHADMNTENRELIKAHIEYSDAILNLVVGSEDPLNNFYEGDGKAAPERKKATGFFDGRA